MGYTETQWRQMQIRSVDPYASYYSDIVNKHTRVVTLGNDTILSGLKPESINNTLIRVSKGIAVKDDVLLQFTSDVDIDTTDVAFYADNMLPTTLTTYYITVVYKYVKVRPAPYAKISLCKRENFNTEYFLFLGAVEIDENGIATNLRLMDVDADGTILAKRSTTGSSEPDVLLDLIKQVDGEGSGLDTDMVDGRHVNDSDVSDNSIWTSLKVSTQLSGLDDSVVHKTGDLDEVITGNKTFQNNVTIVGDLTIQGTTTAINSTELTIEDTVVTLNSTLTTGTPPDTLKSGIEVLRGDEPKATFYWIESLDRWQFEQPINLQSLYFNYPNDNTDTLFIARHDIDVDQTTLRVAIGDNIGGDDFLDVGSVYNTWTSVFRVYNNGDVWIKRNLDVEGNITLVGTINGVSIGSSGGGSGLDADTLDGKDAADLANVDLSNVEAVDVLNKIKTVDGSGSELDADTVDGLHSDSFLRRDVNSSPVQDNSISLGSTTLRFANIYSVNFIGTASQAYYADLAEKYTCKEELPVGSPVCVSLDKDYEVELCKHIACDRFVGIVSENPAYLMNAGGEGIAVALKGKVKALVKGQVNKGDMLTTSEDGCLVKTDNKIDKVAIALENSCNDQKSLLLVLL